MQSIGVQPNQQHRFGFLPSYAIKIITAATVAVVLIIALNYLSTTYLVMLGLLSGMALMFIYQIETVNTIDTSKQEDAAFTVYFDGGSFSHHDQIQTKVGISSVVHDGGSHERSSIK